MAIKFEKKSNSEWKALKSNSNFLEFDPLQLQLQLHFFESSGITGRYLKM